ncbi:hypothetical protein RHOSPDRAFT_30960 [Rhodotorula sp. JG-1b]|nr:hypothetical protein RHOSPDRAFT_30960 [Rhodotorula sp. JG-1b]
MRFHCLGVGSIGSLLATNLAQLPSTQVRLILRRKDLAKQLLNAPADAADPTGVPYGTLTVERDGLKRRTAGLEMELTKSPNDFFERSAHTTTNGSSSSSRGSAAPRIDPRVWNRQDPIQTLVVTTKTPATVPAIRHLLPRLSSRSTIVLCQNGMGVLEALLEKYWPEDRSDEIERAIAALAAGPGREGWWGQHSAGVGGGGGGGGRPSFVCATTTHGAWRKGAAHFVHAGMGDLKFGVVPNRAVMSFLSSYPDPAWSSDQENPILNPRSLVEPTLEQHLPYAPVTSSLYSTVSSLLQLKELHPVWLPLPTLQIAQLQKLAVNASVNSITAIAGVHNGALVGSQKAKRVIESVTRECADVFAAHVAYEQGLWRPDSSQDGTASSSSPHPPPPPPPPPLPISHPLSSHSLLDYTLRVLMKTSVNISSTLSDLLPLQSNLPPTRSTFSLAQNAPSLPSRTEIEYINGYVVALGRRYGIRTDTVETLGELVLLKEEMARVGAVDRVWQSRGGAAVAATSARASSPSPSLSAAHSTSGDESTSSTPTRRRRVASEPLNPAPPPSSTAESASSFSSTTPASPSSSPPPPSSEHPYDRAARHIQLTRESEARARRREYERIARDRDDRAALANG